MAERGKGFRNFILLLLLAAGVYALIKHTPAYVRDLQIQGTLDTAAKFYADPAKRRMVDDYLYRKIKEMELPIDTKDINIEESDDGSTVRIWLDWSYDVVLVPENPYVPQWVRTLNFHDEAVQPIKR